MINEESLKKYYELGWEVGLLDLVKEEILKKNPMKFRILAAVNLLNIDHDKEYRILDVGCGVGTTSFLIGERHPNVYFTCVDISEKQIHLAQKFAESLNMKKRYEFIVGDVKQALPCFERKYDYVICCEILEHLPDPTKLLKNVSLCGSETTNYIFSVPLGKNKNNCTMFRVLDEKGDSLVINDFSKIKDYKTYYEFYHKLYSLAEAKLLLERNGFQIEKIVGSRFLKGSIIGYYINKITDYSLSFDQRINKMTNNYLAENITLFCRKAH